MTTAQAFKMGFEDAAMGGRLQTYRQVSTAYPTLTDEHIDAYQNGWEDGKAGDTFRLEGLISLGRC